MGGVRGFTGSVCEVRFGRWRGAEALNRSLNARMGMGPLGRIASKNAPRTGPLYIKIADTHLFRKWRPCRGRT